MRYDVEKHQVGKVHKIYCRQLTKFMSKNALEQFLRTFTGFKRADIMVKRDKNGKGNVGKNYAIYIRKENKLRRKEDKEIKMKLSDYLYGQIVLGKKREGISLLKRFM